MHTAIKTYRTGIYYSYVLMLSLIALAVLIIGAATPALAFASIGFFIYFNMWIAMAVAIFLAPLSLMVYPKILDFGHAIIDYSELWAARHGLRL